MRWALVGLLTAAYPLLVYLGLGHVEPRWLALLLAALAVLRALASPRRDPFWWWAALAALLLAAGAALINQAMPLKVYPVVVNLGLLMLFGASLSHPPTVVERIARLTEPDLDAAGVRYTRRVTQVWCGFFMLNGSLAMVTAWHGDDRLWALYNGLIAYLLMGGLMGAEWLVRRRVRAAQGAAS